MVVLEKAGDGIKGEKIICQYRKENNAILIRLTGGYRGMRRVIMGLPCFAVIDKEWM